MSLLLLLFGFGAPGIFAYLHSQAEPLWPSLSLSPRILRPSGSGSCSVLCRHPARSFCALLPAHGSLLSAPFALLNSWLLSLAGFDASFVHVTFWTFWLAEGFAYAVTVSRLALAEPTTSLPPVLLLLLRACRKKKYIYSKY